MVLYIDSFEKTALVALSICPIIELPIICYKNHERRCDLLNHFSHARVVSLTRPRKEDTQCITELLDLKIMSKKIQRGLYSPPCEVSIF